MFLGADVTHAHAGFTAPSIAAVTSTVDKAAVKYNTYIRAQGYRVEVISEMKEIMDAALADFRKANGGKNPERVIFFRDGVASGQFAEVCRVEVSALKQSMVNNKCNATLTFFVVQKRHHIRLFPTDNNKDRSENCLPGTVIDKSITHPTEFK